MHGLILKALMYQTHRSTMHESRKRLNRMGYRFSWKLYNRTTHKIQIELSQPHIFEPGSSLGRSTKRSISIELPSYLCLWGSYEYQKALGRKKGSRYAFQFLHSNKCIVRIPRWYFCILKKLHLNANSIRAQPMPINAMCWNLF